MTGGILVGHRDRADGLAPRRGLDLVAGLDGVEAAALEEGKLVADQETDGVWELFASRLDGTNNRKISGPMAGSGVLPGYCNSFAISSDSTRVVYVAQQDDPVAVEIYAAAMDGTGSVKLNGPMVPGGRVVTGAPILITPDSQKVVYLVFQGDPAVQEQLNGFSTSGKCPD